MTKQRDLSTPWMIAIFVVSLIVGAVGWYVWYITSRPDTSDTGRKQTASTNYEYKSLTVNGHKLRYPLDENNQQVIIEESSDPRFPQIAFTPLRRHFAASADEACRTINEGLLQVDSLANLRKSIDQDAADDPVADQKVINSFIAAGLAVKLDDDLYALAPRKQGEACKEATKPKDAKLQLALFEAQEIERQWLASLKLAE